MSYARVDAEDQRLACYAAMTSEVRPAGTRADSQQGTRRADKVQNLDFRGAKRGRGQVRHARPAAKHERYADEGESRAGGPSGRRPIMEASLSLPGPTATAGPGGGRAVQRERREQRAS